MYCAVVNRILLLCPTFLSLRYMQLRCIFLLLLSTSIDVRRIGSQLTADCYIFDLVKEFIYLGSTLKTKNDISLDIKRKITLAETSLSSRGLSRMTKVTLYKVPILHVLVYDAEVWTLLNTEAVVRVFESECYVKYSMQFELAMIFASDLTVSCMCSSTI